MNKGVVVVTGGSRGIGAEIAVASAQAGHDVVIGYVDSQKQKRADGVISQIVSEGQNGLAVRADLTDPDQAEGFLNEARSFADFCNEEVLVLVHSAAGGLEMGAVAAQADEINAVAAGELTSNFLIGEQRVGHTALTKHVVYVTSNPSHFYGHPQNVLPSANYEIVAASKHRGEEKLRNDLSHQDFGVPHRLLVASADLVDNTAGATLLRLAYRRSTGNRAADLLAERSDQLQEIIGRGIANARELGGAIVSMFMNENLPNGYTLYVPQPVLGEYVVPPDELPFGLGRDQALYTFVK